MTLSLLLGCAALLLLGAFFVLAEFAAVRVRATQLEAIKERDARAKAALEVHRDLGRHLTSIQVAITLLTITLGAVGEDAFVKDAQRLFAGLPWPHAGLILGTALGLLFVTLLQVVLAELVPRGLAIRAAVPWALRTAGPLLLWSKAIRPLTAFLQALSGAVERLLGAPGEAHGERAPSEEELKHILYRSRAEGTLDLTRQELIENLFQFSKRTVREVMVPRVQAAYLDLRLDLEANLGRARETPHTRLPLVDGDLDRVIGIVHLKDLLWSLHERGAAVDLRALARPAFFAPETQSIQSLLLEFQQRKQHLALVVDEHGGVDGLVTLEDVLEELVGEIQDEFDRETIQLSQRPNGSWLAQGTVTLEQLEDHLNLKLEGEEGSVSLGGYFQEQLGRVLRVGDELRIEGYRIRVLAMRGLAPARFLLKPVRGDERH
ncbi:MAG: HlyC/CorC family transporter [Acidobacteria bacterium]|nr:HlyC/CorC family transporter [Acidobacteriota bacterium]